MDRPDLEKIIRAVDKGMQTQPNNKALRDFMAVALYAQALDSQPKRTEEELFLAMEFGYKQCEKGNNLERACSNFAIVLNGKNNG